MVPIVLMSFRGLTLFSSDNNAFSWSIPSLSFSTSVSPRRLLLLEVAPLKLDSLVKTSGLHRSSDEQSEEW